MVTDLSSAAPQVVAWAVGCDGNPDGAIALLAKADRIEWVDHLVGQVQLVQGVAGSEKRCGDPAETALRWRDVVGAVGWHGASRLSG